jgi:threonine aldolase
MSKRLQEDHDNARALAEGLAALPYFQLDLDMVQSNIIFCSLSDDAPLTPDEIAARLKADYNILIRPRGTYGFRFVTHYWIKRDHVDRVLEALRAVLTGTPAHSHSAAD